RFVIVGHTPTLGISGKAEIFHHNQFIAIDCGACFQDGALACLCLDTMEEFYC
ncbi:MAG TPA: serine/threonine protein phosphatase, partial [Candidatus Onthosoma merdavium]|nr:serine/threonine protein phosphatase [Candidatus Onthosoma merdavium]